MLLSLALDLFPSVIGPNFCSKTQTKKKNLISQQLPSGPRGENDLIGIIKMLLLSLVLDLFHSVVRLTTMFSLKLVNQL